LINVQCDCEKHGNAKAAIARMKSAGRVSNFTVSLTEIDQMSIGKRKLIFESSNRCEVKILNLPVFGIFT